MTDKQSKQKTQDKKSSEAQATSDQTPSNMPPLYSNPVPINKENHGGFGIHRTTTAEFAASLDAVPLGVSEFEMAQADYPILFIGEDEPIAVALLGTGNRKNLMIEEDGKWAPGHYLPAYIRRFPFIMADIGEGQGRVLCVEDGTDIFKAGAEQPFFDDKGETTEEAKKVLNFCEAFSRELDSAKALGKALREKNLLIDNQAAFRSSTDGNVLRLDGYKVVARDRLDSLDNDTLLEWRNRGWLGQIYAHLFSMQSWNRIANRLSNTQNEAA